MYFLDGQVHHGMLYYDLNCFCLRLLDVVIFPWPGAVLNHTTTEEHFLHM
ncbi:hypothetical protein CDL12_17150 [Handroanthus impetiginosus]|uniref:Uncharacterized protein n=1 Tax=Handroanthus impetiginosus TaxID=429701 RepID=A0A2G9GYB0_9LAMI|nr:hypothetical protein CDL12_17150 [Handroanthus impetiginosus]